MLADLFGWAASLTMPILIGGDFNEARETSSCLSLIYRLNLFFLSPSSSTTKTRAGCISRGHAIDHFIGHMATRECMAWAEPNYERTLSDHFPLEGSSVRRHSVVFGIGHPLFNMDKNLLVHVEWEGHAQTYVEWCRLAETWLAKAYQTHGDSKLTVTSSPVAQRTFQPDPTYQTICAAQRALRHIPKSDAPTESQLASLKRKLNGLGVWFVSLDQAEANVSSVLKDFLNTSQKNSIEAWKKKVACWTISAKQLYTYVKNPTHRKCFGLKGANGVTNKPDTMYRLLQEYWTSIEKWPTPDGLQDALSAAENLYGMFLPYFEAAMNITPLKLSCRS